MPGPPAQEGLGVSKAPSLEAMKQLGCVGEAGGLLFCSFVLLEETGGSERNAARLQDGCSLKSGAALGTFLQEGQRGAASLCVVETFGLSG